MQAAKTWAWDSCKGETGIGAGVRAGVGGRVRVRGRDGSGGEVGRGKSLVLRGSSPPALLCVLSTATSTLHLV